MTTNLSGIRLLSFKGFAKHLLNPAITDTPKNEVFAKEQYCSSQTINSRIRVLEKEGLIHVERWKVNEPAPFRRIITVTEKGIAVLLDREPEFMAGMGYDENGIRK